MNTIDLNTLRKYALGWFGLMVLAIINGIARNSLYGPSMSELTAHQVSTATGIALVLAATWLMNRRWVIPDKKTAQAIGVMWLMATIVFEFGFGHYVIGHSWDRLLRDYNLLEGRVWLLFLAATTVIPYIVHLMDKRQN
jgi:hypothetical protein